MLWQCGHNFLRGSLGIALFKGIFCPLLSATIPWLAKEFLRLSSSLTQSRHLGESHSSETERSQVNYLEDLRAQRT